MMNDNELHILLRRFMEGETTLDEERRLGEWFRDHEVDDDLKPYQRMFAAFDEGLPVDQPQSAPHQASWWRWVAAACVVGFLALGAYRLTVRDTVAVEEKPMVAKTTTDTIPSNAENTMQDRPVNVVNMQQLAEARQAEPAVVTANKTQRKKRSAEVGQAPAALQTDSMEVTRTEADLELAESEFLAEQMELEQQLRQLRQQRAQQQGGWHYTTLPCE